MDLKIAFFGNGHNSATTLTRLIPTEFKPTLVITGGDVQKGRGQKIQSSPPKIIAQKNHIRTLEPQNLTDESFRQEFTKFAPDLTILIAYGKIIPGKVLTIPKHGFVNIHPSLLPKYRGPSPIYQALLNDDSQTGVTIMKLDKELDHGPILAQKKLPIDKADTHETLMQKLAIVGTDLLLEILPHYLDGSLKPKEQDHSKAITTEKITKENGRIDLQNPPEAEKLDRMIRAFYPWPGVWIELETGNTKQETKKLRIKFFPPTSLSSHQPTRLDSVDPRRIDPFQVQPEGKRPLSISEFKNGYPEQYKQIENLIKP